MCKYWPYLEKVALECPELSNLTDMKPFLSVMHAKAHTCKCEVQWGGRNQDGAGTTIGEDVEQVNSFLSRIAICIKYMSKAAQTDMLTLQAMGWNNRKMQNMDNISKIHEDTLQKIRDETDSLENMKTELGYTDDVLQQSVTDVQQWAACATAEDNEAGLQGLQNTIEGLFVSIKQRTHHLYCQTETAVGLYTKKRVFNKVMLLRRLHEEEVILVRELKQHLRRSAGTLRDFASQLSDDLSRHSCPLGLAEEGYSGLHCVVQRRISELKSHQDNVRDTYSRIIGLDATILDEDIENEDFESSQYDSTGEERGTIAERTVCLA